MSFKRAIFLFCVTTIFAKCGDNKPSEPENKPHRPTSQEQELENPSEPPVDRKPLQKPTESVPNYMQKKIAKSETKNSGDSFLARNFPATLQEASKAKNSLQLWLKAMGKKIIPRQMPQK